MFIYQVPIILQITLIILQIAAMQYTSTIYMFVKSFLLANNIIDLGNGVLLLSDSHFSLLCSITAINNYLLHDNARDNFPCCY